jgi:hypothetical protein
MIDVRVKVTSGLTPPQFVKQLKFATASALTQVAKEGQAASIKAIESTFTIRNNWDKPTNRFGVKVTPAKKDNLVSEVYTLADWLDLHEESGVKQPTKKWIAIPTKNVRRTKREIIQKGQRPAGLRGKGDVVLKTKTGKTVLFQRKGKGKKERLIPMYYLVPMAKIRKRSTVFAPVEAVFNKRFGTIFNEQLEKALAGAK